MEVTKAPIYLKIKIDQKVLLKLFRQNETVFETIILWFAFLSLQTCTILIVNAKKLLTFVLANL